LSDHLSTSQSKRNYILLQSKYSLLISRFKELDLDKNVKKSLISDFVDLIKEKVTIK